MSALTRSSPSWPTPPGPDCDEANWDRWLAELCEHQRSRWLAGDRVPAQAYLQRYPELQDDLLAHFRLSVNEAVLSRETGQEPVTGLRDAPEARTVPVAVRPRSPATTPTVSVINRGASQPEFPGYAVVEKLGGGGMGVVYKALDVRLDRLVAIKVLKHRSDPGLLQRFALEARAMARLDHPHIVPIYGAGMTGGSPFLVLKYLSGGTLAGHKAPAGTNPVWAAEVMEKVARAVDYLHCQKVLHRDLKPANILLDEAGQPFVADFGIAKLLEEEGNLTYPGTVVGTLAYMAPEQVRGELHRVGPASEVWSLGIILYELLVGWRPHQHLTQEQLAQAIVSGPVPRLRHRRPSLCAELEAIVHRCLDPNPEQRFASAAQLADALRDWLAGMPSVDGKRLHRRAALGAVCATVLGMGGMAAGLCGATPRVEPEPRRARVWPLFPARAAAPQPVWAAGKPTSEFRFVAGNKALLAHSRDIGLLDLGQPPPCQAYRLEVDLYHEDGEESVGVYLARQMIPGPEGERHFFLLLTLVEARNRKYGNARLQLACFETAGTGAWRFAQISNRRIPLRPANAPLPLRKLTLEVGAFGFRGLLDDVSVTTATPTLLALAVQALEAPQWVPAAGPAGLFVRRSTARVLQAQWVESL